MATKRLYVGNLAYDVRDAQLRDLFAPFGPVTAVELIGTRGFAFVEVPEERAAEAIQSLNGTQQFGRSIVVNEARPRGELRNGDRSRAGGPYRGRASSGGPQGGRPGGPQGGRPGGGSRPGTGRSGGGRPGGGGAHRRGGRAERRERRGW